MARENPWLSILIPVYNVEAWLKDCIDSVTSQIISGIEIITLEDCSTDNSLNVLQQLVDKSSTPIRILRHEKNRGLSAARNSLIEAASGDYLWFLDSDDALQPGAIHQLQQVIKKHSPDLIMCDFRVWREHQKPKHRWRGENQVSTFTGRENRLQSDQVKLFEGLYRAGNLHIWSKISRRDLWNDIRFPEGKVMEDMVVTPRVALKAKTYFYQTSVWVAYRQREGSILSSFSEKKIDDMSQACAGILNEWITVHPNLSRPARFAFVYFCVKTHICISRNVRSLYKNPETALNIYRQRFFEHIGWSKANLYWEYIKRGWLIRLNRFIAEH
jgi:glycosyltransferase involved in cell wall biosynthesis